MAEAQKEYYRLWRQKNPQKAREAVRRWRAKNPERVLENSRAWRAKHPTYMAQYAARWRANNPEKAQASADKCNSSQKNRRALIRAKRRAADSVSVRQKSSSKRNMIDVQVAHHLRRGRDCGTIAVWMGIPVSVVAASILRLQNTPS